MQIAQPSIRAQSKPWGPNVISKGPSRSLAKLSWGFNLRRISLKKSLIGILRRILKKTLNKFVESGFHWKRPIAFRISFLPPQPFLFLLWYFLLFKLAAVAWKTGMHACLISLTHLHTQTIPLALTCTPTHTSLACNCLNSTHIRACVKQKGCCACEWECERVCGAKRACVVLYDDD